MGVGRRLREHNPAVKIVAGEPHQDDLLQGLRSLADGFIPPILDLDLLDRKIVVRGHDGLHMTRELVRVEGIFAGISSGAALHVALRVASEMDSGNVVVLFADGGWKYLSTGLWKGSLDEVVQRIATKVMW